MTTGSRISPPPSGASTPADVLLVTDGACIGNPGPGGWAFLLRFGGHEREGHGGDPSTTNNRMEILAVIRGLEALKRPCKVRLLSDSQYVVNAINHWIKGWKAKGWRRKRGSGGELANPDLWRQLDALLQVKSVRAEWVRGHAGHRDNERVDRLAQAEAARFGLRASG